jgi:hypothetical protein
MTKALLAALAVLAIEAVALFSYPQPLFPYRFQAGNLTLYSDQPLPETATAAVLADVQQRLERSPLYAARAPLKAFLCNSGWRHRLFFLGSPGGGLAYGLPPWNAFLRRCDINRNELPRLDGSPSGPDRPLSYFIAHELTHTLCAQALGPWAFRQLPAWVKEGYADEVGRGGHFDFAHNRALYQAHDPTLDPSSSGLYLRYQLMVEQALKTQGVMALLQAPPDRATVEAALLAP